MGRPRKQTADWFPHYVADSRTKFILEDSWGNNGYAFWFKLLELLCKSDGHYYDCSTATNRKYLTAVTKVDEATVLEIMNTLADLEKIDRGLWCEKQIAWCQTLVDNLSMMYSKRTVSAPEKPCISEFSEIKTDNEDISGDGNRQSVLQEVAPQETTAEDTECNPPANGAKPKGEPRKKKTAVEPDKIKYAEFVYMTEEEYEKLITSHGKEKTARMIEILDNYKGSKGTTYKSDYRAILNWVVERVNEEVTKKGAVNYGGFSADRQDIATSIPGFKPSGGFKK